MSNRGHHRERQVRHRLQAEDWVVIRSSGSLGCCDLVALRDGVIRMIEVKSTAAGPYERFGPAARAELALAARLAGATAWIAWWPPRGRLRWIGQDEWPPPTRRGEVNT